MGHDLFSIPLFHSLSKASEAMTGVEPVINPYLWALGDAALDLTPGTEVAGRYKVIAPQVWLDTQPEMPIEVPQEIDRELLPYLYLYPERLHLPVVYDVCPLDDYSSPVVLFENVPLEGAGSLQPAFVEQLSQATTLRQMYWFGQILELWEPLEQLGVAVSLLIEENLRVEGWRVRLRELYAAMGKDKPLGAGVGKNRYTEQVALPTLTDLGDRWLTWAEKADESIRGDLKAIGEQLRDVDADVHTVLEAFNKLLLRQSAQFALRMQTAGQTDPGPEHRQNEDSCYPLPTDLKNRGVSPDSLLIPHVAIVCDGIGGHDGGEVASQMAVRSLKLQIQALFGEFAASKEPLSPQVVMEQISASVRVVNNLISAQNDSQEREIRQRMGTTLVMAIHVQQPLKPTGPFAHEVYLVNVGDSRAYWMTQRYCQALTVDNDVACREVRLGRDFYRSALQRQDAGSLTQALGIREGQHLQVTVQRLVLDEDGLLLLCSDGLSDNGQVEKAWSDSVAQTLSGQVSLEQAAQEWVDLANERNGHDNVSVVVSRCRVSPDYSVVLDSEAITPVSTPAESLTEASEALLSSVPEPEPVAKPPSRLAGFFKTLLALLLILGLGSVIGYVAFKRLNPDPVPGGEPIPGEPLPEPTPIPSADGEGIEEEGARLDDGATDGAASDPDGLEADPGELPADEGVTPEEVLPRGDAL